MYKNFVNIAPFVMLVITGLSGLFSSLGWYSVFFNYLPDLLGYSIFTNLIMLRVYNAKTYCHTTRLAVYGLIAMNLTSLITIDTKYYNPLYDVFITLVIFGIIYFLKFKNAKI